MFSRGNPGQPGQNLPGAPPGVRRVHIQTRIPMFQGPIPELLGAFMGGMPTGLGVHVNFRQRSGHPGQPGFRGQRGPFGQAIPNNKRKQAAKILNVSENATEAEIDKAYKNHAVKWHPDKHPPERKPLAKKKFEEGGKARDILKGKQSEISGENGEQTVFANFANKVFEDFMRSSAGPQTEEDELDAEAEDLFEFLHGMDGMAEPPPGHPHIFRFGPNFGPRGQHPRQPQPPQQSQEPLNFRVRIDLKDIWLNASKNIPVHDTHLLLMPLHNEEILYENSNGQMMEGKGLPWSEIAVKILDKPNPKFRRRGRSWDLETVHPILLEDLYKDHLLEIDLPNETKQPVLWKKDNLNQMLENVDKGFYLYDLGLPRQDGTRGKLWVRFAVKLPDILKDIPKDSLKSGDEDEKKKDDSSDSEDPEQIGSIPEIATQEEWWNVPNEERSVILDLNAYLKLKA